MKQTQDIRLLQSFRAVQSGVFSAADLQSLLGEKHHAQLVRRIRALQRESALVRFIRGWYVTPDDFDLTRLSQRLAPESYLSFGTVLAKALVVGPTPEREIWAAKVGRSRIYEGAGCRIIHLGMSEPLVFGTEMRAGIRWATPEKALIDALYFHLRGQRYPFDIYSDLNLASIDRDVVRSYLRSYANPKFSTFVQGVLDATP